MPSNQIFSDLAIIQRLLNDALDRFTPSQDNLEADVRAAAIVAANPALIAVTPYVELGPAAGPSLAAFGAHIVRPANIREIKIMSAASAIVDNAVDINVNDQRQLIENYQSQIQSFASILATAASIAAKSASKTFGELRNPAVPDNGTGFATTFGGAKVLKLLKIKMPRIKTAKKKTSTKKAAPKKKTVTKKKTVAKKAAPKKAAPKKKTVAKKAAPKKK